jgi:hypothetical protein
VSGDGGRPSFRKPGKMPAVRFEQAFYLDDLISSNGLFSFFSSTNFTTPVAVSITYT